jgi:hypothetical protein
MLTPEKDTYITIKEANELLAFEPQAEKWATLSDECKEACLRSAARHIDGLRLSGFRRDLHQPMAFPRNHEDTPEEIKMAQVLEALALADIQASLRRRLQEQGVTSINLGKASESYDSANKPYTGALISVEAYKLMRPYLKGTVAIV